MYDVLKIIIALGCLLYASYHDMKTRKIPSWIWWLMGIPALIFYGIDAYMSKKEMLIMLIPLAAVLIEALTERDDLRNIGSTWPFFLMYMAALAALLWGYSFYRNDSLFLSALSATGISVFFFALYSINILHGAADVKALVMLSLLFYGYPLSAAQSAPYLSVLFPFSLSVMLLASLFGALLPIYFLILNLAKGNMRFPEMLFGYPMDIERARDEKVWPMLVIKDGRAKRMLLPPKYMDIDWDTMEKAGIRVVWVTPKIPFIVPITIGFMLTVILGNPLAYFL